jgi:hypothetical protein
MTLIEFYKRLCQKLKARRKRIPSLPEVVVMLRSKELVPYWSIPSIEDDPFITEKTEKRNFNKAVLVFDKTTGYVKIVPLIQIMEEKLFSHFNEISVSFGGINNKTILYVHDYTSPWVRCLIKKWPKDEIECYVINFIYLAIEFLFTETETESAKVNQYTFFSLYTGPPGIRQLFSISIPLRRVLFASDIL